MPQYSYTVINKENQQLNGTINAPDELSARKELNAMEFAILSLTDITNYALPTAEAVPENVIKFEFSANDKNGKKVVGTIQGEDIFSVYKRLLFEYKFDVQQLFSTALSDKEKDEAIVKGVDELKDRLAEEKMAQEEAQKKHELDEIEFEKKQVKMKGQIEFILQKVSEMLDTYKDELDPPRRTKIKYFVEKLLRIKSSTNLDYIKQTCEEMLTYLQKEEIFLHQEQRLKEKTKLSIEAKSMMMQLERIDKGGKDMFSSMREWRQQHITNTPDPSFIDKVTDFFIGFLIGSVPEDDEMIAAREKIRNTNTQLREYVTIYFQTPEPEFKKEVRGTLLNLWHQRQQDKKVLAGLIRKKQLEKQGNVEYTAAEILEKEIFGVTGWVLTFYMIYYFATIYLNSKQISFIPETRLNLLFKTSIVKYFFTTLFFFYCFLGIKIEFFRRKPLATPVTLAAFLICSSLIILNF
jgi:hypothetical protein